MKSNKAKFLEINIFDSQESIFEEKVSVNKEIKDEKHLDYYVTNVGRKNNRISSQPHSPKRVNLIFIIILGLLTNTWKWNFNKEKEKVRKPK